MNISPLVPVLVGSLLAVGCLMGAFFNLRRKRTIDDMPTSKTQGVFIGLSELKGTAESESPFTGYLSGVSCVLYSWHVEEEWRRTVTETYRDSQGHTHTRTRTESGWTRVAEGGESAPFYLKDDTGVIRIVPEGAKIQDNNVFSRTVGLSDPLYFAKGPASAIANSTHHRRFHEEAIPLHTALYVLGHARERQDIVAAEIASDKTDSLFLISTRSEKQISSGYGIWFWVWFALGLLIAVGAGAGWAAVSEFMGLVDWSPIWIMAVGYLAVFLLIYIWTTFNSLINLRNRVKQAWSQVDVQLKRRHDLIPNLVQVVSGYRQYENETQNVLSALRSQMETPAQGTGGGGYKGLAPLLRAVVEQYPDLKASDSFFKLQQALVETEQRIALSRDYFNEIVTFYNTRLETIPDRFVAVIAGLKPQPLLQAADFERSPVRVNLAI